MLLDPNAINLNTGSFGPLPRCVFERVTELRRRLAEEPMDFLLRDFPALLAPARQRLADFLRADPRRLAFTANVTAGINLVAASLRLASPGELLLSDHEYGAMVWCWERAAQRLGLTIRTFPLPHDAQSAEEIAAAARAAFTARTRLLFFSHVVSSTGLVLPARELCAAARERGILTAVDGAHAAAMLPVDLDAVGADFYAGNCHKWLLAPTGSGFLYFGPGATERVQPMQTSWGWHYASSTADEPDEYGSTPRLRSFEFEGTRDPCPWLSVPTAIDFQQKLGWENVRQRIAELAQFVRQRMGQEGSLRLATPSTKGLHGALTAFELPPRLQPKAVRDALWHKFRIEAPIIERADRLLIRVSTHFYNTEAEVDALAAALRVILAD
ncbi:MAG: aminotransferase class V-fold PLP-dependent enzyme [Planctomycetia bacterium]|nr:aminotransferase class V-fold PLP-dependent enzyme [Planctomycetia bacterium]